MTAHATGAFCTRAFTEQVKQRARDPHLKAVTQELVGTLVVNESGRELSKK